VAVLGKAHRFAALALRRPDAVTALFEDGADAREVDVARHALRIIRHLMIACVAVDPSRERAATSPLVAWLRAPAFASNALLRADSTSPLARLSVAPLLFLALAAIATVLVFTTEIYIVRNGIGDDGVIYASIVKAYDGHLGHLPGLGLNRYTAQRCLSPILVRTALNVLGMPVDDPSIITAYKAANAISIAIALACWISAARHLRLSRAGLVAATLLASFNFVTLYWLPFDPVLVDAMALAIGSLQVWAYLTRRYVLLAVISAAGGFLWPSATQVGAVMLFLPRAPATNGGPAASAELDASAKPSPIDLGVAALLTGVITWYASTLGDYLPPYGQLPATKTLFRLSCALFCFVTFIALKELVRVGPSLRQLVRRDRDALLGKVLAVGTVIAVSKIVAWIASAPDTRIPQAADVAMVDVLKSLVFFAVQRPLVALFAHVGFFGPALLLMFWCWRNVCNDARRLGFGMNAALGMAFFMLFNSQSRGAIELMPIVVLLAASAAARLPWTPRRLLELAGVIFVASKLWYAIVQRPKFDFASLMDNVGPWMSNESYYWHGLLTIGISIWFVWTSRQRPPLEEMVWLSEDQPTGTAPLTK
jgi:hypothetical protein